MLFPSLGLSNGLKSVVRGSKLSCIRLCILPNTSKYLVLNFFAYSTELNNDAEAVSTGQGKTTDELEGCFTLKCPGSMASG